MQPIEVDLEEAKDSKPRLNAEDLNGMNIVVEGIDDSRLAN